MIGAHPRLLLTDASTHWQPSTPLSPTDPPRTTCDTGYAGSPSGWSAWPELGPLCSPRTWRRRHTAKRPRRPPRSHQPRRPPWARQHHRPRHRRARHHRRSRVRGQRRPRRPPLHPRPFRPHQPRPPHLPRPRRWHPSQLRHSRLHHRPWPPSRWHRHPRRWRRRPWLRAPTGAYRRPRRVVPDHSGTQPILYSRHTAWAWIVQLERSTRPDRKGRHR